MTSRVRQVLQKIRETQAGQLHRLSLEQSEREVWDGIVTEDETNHSLSNGGMERCDKR